MIDSFIKLFFLNQQVKYASLSYLFMCIEVLFYFSSLWILGKHDTLHIFAKKNPQYINFDESMDYFSYIIEEDYENCSSVSWYQKHWMLIIVEQTDYFSDSFFHYSLVNGLPN